MKLEQATITNSSLITNPIELIQNRVSGFEFQSRNRNFYSMLKWRCLTHRGVVPKWRAAWGHCSSRTYDRLWSFWSQIATNRRDTERSFERSWKKIWRLHVWKVEQHWFWDRLLTTDRVDARRRPLTTPNLFQEVVTTRRSSGIEPRPGSA